MNMNLYEYTNTTELYTEMGEFYVTELYGYMGLYGYQGGKVGGRAINWEVGTDICTLLYIK